MASSPVRCACWCHSNVIYGDVLAMKLCMRHAGGASTHRGSRRNGRRGHSSTGRTADVAGQILRGDVRNRVVVGRDAYIDVLTLILAVDPDILHSDWERCGEFIEIL